MVDFRSDNEKRADQRRQNQEQADYKAMYYEVLRENEDLKGQQSQIIASHKELLEQVQRLHQAHQEHKDHTAKQVGDMTDIAKSIEGMVSSSFEDNRKLMESVRGDIDRRLGQATQRIDLLGSDD